MRPALVIAAHGSVDVRFAAVVSSLAGLVGAARPDLDIRIGYLDHGVPLESVTDPGCVVVPLLLSRGFHVRQDIPSRANGAAIADAVGPDRRLTRLLAARLVEAGWARERPLVLVASGSADNRSLADVHQAARDLGDQLGMDVPAAFLSAGEPSLAETPAVAVASYLLAPGAFHDSIAQYGASIIAAPLGVDPLIAEIILDRYDTAKRNGGNAMGEVAGVDPAVPPTGTGCVECLDADGWWVHLRRCAQCGHIGCCDTSPAQHATAHFKASGHPVIQSFEPGEDWFWNYETEQGYDGPPLAEPSARPADQPVPGPAGKVPRDWAQHIH